MRRRSPAVWIFVAAVVACFVLWPVGVALVVLALLVSDDRPALCRHAARVLVPVGIVLLVASAVTEAVDVWPSAVMLAVGLACGAMAFVHGVVTGIPGRF